MKPPQNPVPKNNFIELVKGNLTDQATTIPNINEPIRLIIQVLYGNLADSTLYQSEIKKRLTPPKAAPVATDNIDVMFIQDEYCKRNYYIY